MRDRFVILCEGVKDRDFWSGWLEYLGSTNSFNAVGRDQTRLKARIKPHTFGPGEFCFESDADDLILVKPCGSATVLWEAPKVLVNQPESPARIVLNVDSDRDAGSEATSGRIERLQQLIQDLTGQRPIGEPPYRVGKTQIDLVVWHCVDGPESPGVPLQQTLERLICASIVEASLSAANPEGWAASVRDFLAREPRGGLKHKNFAHAYWAKWFAHERDDFFQAVWSREDFPEVARQLEKRLKAAGAWQVATSLVNPAENSL